MKISLLDLKSKEYGISCKLYAPQCDPELVVVGVHGFAGDKESSVLQELGKALCARGSALICFDFPAHGQSQAADHFLRVDHCKRDLLTVAEYVKDRYPRSRYGIFATSFGGYITLLCHEMLIGWDMVLRAPAVTMAQTFAEKIIHVPVEEFLANGGQCCGFERKMFVSADFYQDLLHHSFTIPRQPLMIIHGTKDDVVDYGAVAKLAEKYENIRLVPVENADHRFKNPGEMEIILQSAMKHFLGKL